MFRSVLNIFTAVLLLVGALTAVLAGSVEVKSNGAKVYQDANKTSAVISELQAKTVLESKERKGMFWQVSLSDGKIGYVSAMDVQRKTSKDDANFSAALQEAVQEGRQEGGDANNVRSRSTVMGVRGLDESDDTQFAGNVKPNLRVVYSMENLSISKKKITALDKEIERELQERLKAKVSK